MSEGSGRKAKVTRRSPHGTIANALESLQNLSQALEAAGDTQNSKCKGNSALQQWSLANKKMFFIGDPESCSRETDNTGKQLDPTSFDCKCK